MTRPWLAATLVAALGWFAGASPALAASDGHSGSAEAPAGHEEGSGEHEEDVKGINFFYGFFGERPGIEPSLAWRPEGMPPPLAANVINAGILFFFIYYFGRKPIADALKKRKERIVAGMEDAAKMREEASGELAEYEKKLKRIDEEIDRVRRDMQEAAEADRKRILAEAEQRRARMERDARLLVEQEVKAAREILLRETVRGAVRSAEEILAKELKAEDRERLETDYLEMVKSSVNAVGGRA